MHSAICRKHQLDYILALSEDEKVVSIRDKNPIKVNMKQPKTLIRALVTSKSIGIHHYALNIISPLTHEIITRYTLKINTPEPPIQ